MAAADFLGRMHSLLGATGTWLVLGLVLLVMIVVVAAYWLYFEAGDLF